MIRITQIRRKFKAILPALDEKGRRLWAASEALEMGRGGVSKISEATGIARNTIAAGIRELEGRGPGRPPHIETSRIRKIGGGRKSLTDKDSKILPALKKLLESTTRGDPMLPLRWTCKSIRHLADELISEGYDISSRTVARLLKEMDYSLQANIKTKEGASSPDRNTQFEYINQQTLLFQKSGQPVISVDAKKKELVGDFKNAGREWRPKGKPEAVQVHDFPYKDLGKGIPYGIYDITANNGWVSVGTDHDTAEFAAESIRRWWKKMGKRAYPDATELLIMADGGGSNSSRSKLWKSEIQGLSDETKLKISICHFPPGTSKWNKIEHRMFSFITQNWRGRPLYSHQVMVNLIGNTSTKGGLEIQAQLDNENYEIGRKISKKEFEQINLELQPFRGDWNYIIRPRKK